MQRHCLLMMTLLLACGVMLAPAQQFVQQGSKLMSPSSTGSAQQGSSVALSNDGNTALVGAMNDSAGVGAAYVYTRQNGVWSQQPAKLVGRDSAAVSYQGIQVALSADGNTAIVGGTGDDSNLGAARVFVRSGGAWSQQGNKLVGSGVQGAAFVGFRVALSADGNTALVSGPSDSGNTGAVWVFTRSNGAWTQQGSKLVGSGAGGQALQGWSVALSGDGNTALVGSAYDSSSTGAAWVFTRSNGVWTQQGAKLVGTGAIGSARQGWSVALSADGNTALLHGPWDNGGVGSGWIFTRANGVWSQRTKLVCSGWSGTPQTPSNQGHSAALSSRGDIALIGQNGDGGGIGAAWVFAENNGVWAQVGSKLIGTGANGSAWQAYSVALSGDGQTAILGAPRDSNSIGAAWVFAATPQVKITDVVNGASFVPGVVGGSWVTIKGTYLAQTTRIWQASDFTGNSLPTALDGVQVKINGTLAAMYYISPTQLNVQAPAPLSGPVTVQAIHTGGSSNVATATALARQPALFVYAAGAKLIPAAVFTDAAILGDPALTPGTRAAKSGDNLLLFATGLESSPAGVLIPGAIATANPATVTIGSAPAQVTYSGLVAPGEFQINIVVPNLAPGDYPITVQIAGETSPTGVTVPVRAP